MQHNDPHDNLMPKDDSDIVSLANIWRVVPDFFFYLRRPFLVQGYQSITTLALWQLGLLLGLKIIFSLLAVVLIVVPYQEAFGIGDNELSDDFWTFWEFLFFAAIMAPIIEEIAFRGWLKGTKRAFHIIAIIISIAAGYFVVNRVVSDEGYGTIIIFLWGFLVAFEGFMRLKKIWNDKQPIALFAQYFPIIFYVSAFSFGILHITNYDHDSMIELLPMVITQCFGGVLFCYVRLRFGLLAAIIMHGAFNGLLITMAEIASI